MQRWLRLLAVNGILMFSTLGPGTLESLRQLYGRHRWPSPHAPFVDMHDLGDMLARAGFADPVMDQEVLTLTWTTPREALSELRQLGGNADLRRHAGLRTPRWRAVLEEALARATAGGVGEGREGREGREGVEGGQAGGPIEASEAIEAGDRVSLEFEVVYGHAVRPPPRVRVAAETAVPLAELRGMLRQPRDRKAARAPAVRPCGREVPRGAGASRAARSR